MIMYKGVDVSETTKETLVRHVQINNPEGVAVMRTQKVEVEVTWPDGRPEDSDDFTVTGGWKVVMPDDQSLS